jgi:signal transduction histidine kinase
MATTDPRVLLVDDERDFLASLAQRLTLRGLEVATAESGPAALTILDRRELDVVVLDVRMPGMDGIEVLRRIKSEHPRVEVVMLTGHADLSSSLEGMRFGFFDYLTKPVDIDKLIAKIGEAYRRGRGEHVNDSDTFGGKLKDQMIIADRLASLGELAASIAHEINNPLAIISESTGWLRSQTARSGPLPDELARALELAFGKIDGAVDRVRRISHNFLRFARGPNAQLHDVDLDQLAHEVVELTAKPAAAKNVALAVTCHGDHTPVLVTDPFQLRQVLLNLINNAIQAVESAGRVEVLITGSADRITVEVVDDGIGIPPHNIERIFEPFFTTRGPEEGTGLGLSVSRNIVERLGGRIEVTSRPGEGTTMRIVLPRRPEAAAGLRGDENIE